MSILIWKYYFLEVSYNEITTPAMVPQKKCKTTVTATAAAFNAKSSC